MRPREATAGYRCARAAGARAMMGQGQTLWAAERVPAAARPLRRRRRPRACAGAAPAGAARRRRCPSRRRPRCRRWAPRRQRPLLSLQDRQSRQGLQPGRRQPRPLRPARPPARRGCRARRRPAPAAPRRPPPPAACTAARCLRAPARAPQTSCPRLLSARIGPAGTVGSRNGVGACAPSREGAHRLHSKSTPQASADVVAGRPLRWRETVQDLLRQASPQAGVSVSRRWAGPPRSAPGRARPHRGTPGCAAPRARRAAAPPAWPRSRSRASRCRRSSLPRAAPASARPGPPAGPAPPRRGPSSTTPDRYARGSQRETGTVQIAAGSAPLPHRSVAEHPSVTARSACSAARRPGVWARARDHRPLCRMQGAGRAAAGGRAARAPQWRA